MARSHVPAKAVVAIAITAVLTGLVPILPATPALAAPNVFTVTTTGDQADQIPGDGICATIDLACTLRAAIQEANATSNASVSEIDEIHFALVGSAPFQISLTSRLPEITESVLIDGGTQLGYESAPLIRVDGNGVTFGGIAPAGFEIQAGLTQIRALSITRMPGQGILVDSTTSGAYTVLNENWIGVTPTGTAAGNGASGLPDFGRAGIAIESGATHVQVGYYNVISNNAGDGIAAQSADAVVINGNLIGTDPTGATDMGNAANGISIDGTSLTPTEGTATIGGGFGTAEANVISGNGAVGIEVRGSADDVAIRGNLIGTNASGTDDIPNGTGISGAGVKIVGSGTGNVVGNDEVSSDQGNLISGNAGQAGVWLSGSNVQVGGNMIGTTITGNAALPNARGVLIQGADNVVGGDADGRNVISGNTGPGILISGGSAVDTPVVGNLIGIGLDGTTPVGNGTGISLTSAAGGRIGGWQPGEGNVIAGNGAGGGISLDDSDGVDIRGNLIGTDEMGEPEGNGGVGVRVSNSAGATIAENVIVATTGPGVELTGADTTNAGIYGNSIGTDGSATPGMGNTGAGIRVSDTSSDAGVIGELPDVFGGNTIRDNGGAGVRVEGSSTDGVTIQRNWIEGNGGLGIDLGPAGVTVNDETDEDAGPNGLQNRPSIDGGVDYVEGAVVDVSLDSEAYGEYEIDVYTQSACDPSGSGEGAVWIGSDTLFTGPDQFGTLEISTDNISNGEILTATATSQDTFATSEFSECFEVGAAPDTGPATGLAISTSTDTVGAGFSEIPLTDLDLTGAGLPDGVLEASSGPLTAPLGQRPLGQRPLGQRPLGQRPLGQRPLGQRPLGQRPAGLSETLSPLRDVELGQLVDGPLPGESPLLSELPLAIEGGWQSVLGEPTIDQSLTLNDVIGLPAVGDLKIDDISWGATRFSSLSPASWLLGRTSLADIPLPSETWADLDLGPDCDVDPDATSVLELEWRRCDLKQIPWGQIALADIDLTGSPLEDYRLDGLDLFLTPLGSLPCTAILCEPGETGTLAEAQAAGIDGRLLDVTFGAFSAGELGATTLTDIMPGILDVTDYPIGAIPVNDLVRAAQVDESDQTVGATVSFAIPCGSADGAEITVSLPPGFRYLDGSSELSVGDDTSAAEPAYDAGTGSLTWTLQPTSPCTPGNRSVVLTFQAVPGPNAGLFTFDVTVTPPGQTPTEAEGDPLTVTPALELGDTPADAVTIEPDTLYLTTIQSGTDRDYFRIDAPAPGWQVAVYLEHLSRDDDLTLYADSATGANLRDFPLGQRPLGQRPLGQRAVNDQVGCLPTGYVVEPQTLEDVPVLGDGYAVRGFSTNRSEQDEVTCTVAQPADDGTDYTIQVSGYNGSFSGSPYVLRALLIPPSTAPQCDAADLSNPSTPGTLPTSIPAGTQTLILTNQERMQGMYGQAATDPMFDGLDELAAQTQGVVIPVEGDPAVAQAYDALDADPCSADAANGVVKAINRLIDGLRGQHDLDLEFLVIAGTDDIVPFARIQDLTTLGNQVTYAANVRLTDEDNPTSRAFGLGLILSDDPYASFEPIPWNGNELYIPSLALGRLVETPGEIAAQVQRFLDFDGAIDPSTALSTGYDFAQDAATRVADVLDARGLAPVRRLISDTWDADDLATQLDGSDVSSLNGHFDHYRAEPAAGNDLLTSQEFAASGVPDGLLLFTVGCNAGVSVPDVYLTGPDPEGVRDDWAQVVARKEGTLVANNGFGYGDSSTIAYSERLMELFAENLDGSMSLGQALALAKAEYYGGLGALGAYDVKSLQQATFYGLPMFRVGPDGEIADDEPPGGGPAVSTDPDTGLPAAEVTIADFVDPAADLRTDPDGRGQYYVGPEVQVTHYRPIQPLSRPFDMTRGGGQRLHDALVVDLTVQDIPGFDPVYARPTIDDTQNEPEPTVSDGVFPGDFTAASSVLTAVGRRDYLVAFGGRFTTRNADGSGIQRIYRSTALRAFYSTSDDFARPTFSLVRGDDLGSGNASFVVETPSTDVAQVYISYLPDDGSGRFVMRRLTGTTTGRWTGSVNVGVPIVDFFAQAVDADGNVAVSTFKNLGFLVQTAPTPPAGVTIGTNGDQRGGWFIGEAIVTITSDDGEIFEASVDGSPFAPVPGDGEIPVDGDGTHEVRYRGSRGTTGSVQVPIDDAPPTIQIAFGEPNVAGSPTTIAPTTPITVTVNDGASGVASCAIRVIGPSGTRSEPCAGGANTFPVGGPSGDVRIEVDAEDNVDGLSTDERVSRVDADGPGVAVTYLSGPTAVVGGQRFVRAATLLRATATDPTGIAACAVGASGAKAGGPVDCSDGETDVSLGGLVSAPRPDGSYTVMAGATDGLGNAGAGTLTVLLDETAPTIGACPDLGTIAAGTGTRTVTVTATDTGVGFAGGPSTTVSQTFSTAVAGPVAVTLTATDLVGNAATRLCSYTVTSATYLFTGFAAPIDNLPVVNVAKGGSAVPVKWRLRTASGDPIADPASFVSLTSAQSPGACAGGDPDAIETYAPTSNPLVYNGNGWWQIDWKTNKAWAGTCRTLKLTLADGTERTALFRFK